MTAALALATLYAAAVVAQPRPLPFRVIVHPSNPTASLDRKFLGDAFLKKTTRWDRSGEVIRPVDQSADSAVRRAFSDEILSRSVEAVKNYWQQGIFSGRNLPPPELDTDEDVVKYVLKHPGAIGYISASANPGSAKVLTVQ